MNISCKDGHNTGQKWYDLTEAKDIKKRWQEYTEKLYKKDLNDPDNQDGVITHLEPDILEWEVSWALDNIITKLVEVVEFQLSYLKSWKVMLWKCCTQYTSKFGRLSSGHRPGKGQFLFQFQRKAMEIMLKLLHNCTHLVLLPGKSHGWRSLVGCSPWGR